MWKLEIFQPQKSMISFNGPRNWSPVSVDGRNPANSPVQVGSFSYNLQRFMASQVESSQDFWTINPYFPKENHDKLQLNPWSWCHSSGDFRRRLIYTLNSPRQKKTCSIVGGIYLHPGRLTWNPTNHLFRKEHDRNQTSIMKCSMFILRFVTFNSHRIHVWNIYLHSTIEINHSCR